MENIIASLPATQYFTTGDGVRIAYELEGETGNPVLVLSNSIATDYHMWDVQMPAFTRFFQVLRFDTRGNGASGAPAGDYSINRMALDVIELLDHLGIEKAHFLGLSLGGFIGQYLAIHTPERIDKLVLANTSSYLGPQAYFNKQIKSLQEGATMDGFADMFIHNWFPAAMISNGDSRVAPFRDMVLNTPPLGLAGSFAAVRDGDLRKTAALIPHATLIIGGQYDTVTLPEHSELLAATIVNSSLTILPVVHLSNIESSERFNELVIDFLQD
ncbi:3-oxoadipate enol-lactonase [Chitinophaga polysaccharea]|uniref:3-oxoadipate enol-lactonase n=1 Tax=Chitinophaga polysaccharea TaxID=1293035 RepID=A0A561P3I6_9BACT|nr:alpha/beta hydrolase [Chitinophaga polysaccharea]TWF32644.1 3-oxoadipate enol-lactonase [Chitinophaga polysaccharea]